MRKFILVIGLCMMCGCSQRAESVKSSVVESISEAVVTETASEYDTAFGLKCRYVSGEEEIQGLMCAKKIVQSDWKTAADGWNLKQEGDIYYIEQVYDSEDVLLLPADFGANTHVVIGLNGEEETECEPCSESE